MFKITAALFEPQRVETLWTRQHNIFLDILRTDLLHPVVSGNKWFKLKYHVEDALAKHFDTILTFGGCFSNHIVATAFACKQAGLKAMGIIRGELESAEKSHTLQQALSYGMQLHFVTREQFRDKEAIKKEFKNVYHVNEGGYGMLGAKGAGEMLTGIADHQRYHHIVLATGTGATMAGIVEQALPYQKITGVSVMKNNRSLDSEMRALLSESSVHKNYEISHRYHFGGYARKSEELLLFMNEFYMETKVPTDFVYTAKACYALKEMIVQGDVAGDSRVLFIHTGGLQGNLSLPKSKLIF